MLETIMQYKSESVVNINKTDKPSVILLRSKGNYRYLAT